MQPVSYKYPFWIRTMKWFLLFFCLSAIIYALTSFASYDTIFGLAFSVIIILDLAWFWNLYPEIIVGADGLLVLFFFWWLPVKWEDIIDVKLDFVSRITSNWPGIFRNNQLYVVRTRSLTFFQRFYDRPFCSFAPTFYVQSKINGFDELLSAIQNKNLIQPSEKLAV